MSVIQVGDLVELRVSSVVQRPVKSTHTVYKVESVPSNQNLDHQFWELSFGGDLFVIDAPLVLVKRGGAP